MQKYTVNSFQTRETILTAPDFQNRSLLVKSFNVLKIKQYFGRNFRPPFKHSIQYFNVLKIKSFQHKYCS
jgi:hypothetical protein